MRCFSSPGSLRRPMDSVGDDPKGPGFPIRKSADQRALAPPRGLSQRATSFIASQCQGIHQMPLLRLIRSRSQGPEIVSRETGTETARNPKPRSLPCSPPSLRRHTQHFFFAGRPNPKPPPPPGSRPRTRAALDPPADHITYPRCQRTEVGNPESGRLRPLVEPTGIEPATSCLQSRRSPN